MAMNSPEKSSNTRSMLTDTSSGRKFHVNLPESIEDDFPFLKVGYFDSLEDNSWFVPS